MLLQVQREPPYAAAIAWRQHAVRSGRSERRTGSSGAGDHCETPERPWRRWALAVVNRSDYIVPAAGPQLKNWRRR
jgi:hypothetical protein